MVLPSQLDGTESPTFSQLHHIVNLMKESHQHFNGMNELILLKGHIAKVCIVHCVPVASLTSCISFQLYPNVPSPSSSLSFPKSEFDFKVTLATTDYWGGLWDAGYLFGDNALMFHHHFNDDETLTSHARRKCKFSSSGVGAKHKFSLFWSNWETPINLSSHETQHGYIRKYISKLNRYMK